MTFSKLICATMVASVSAGVRGQGPSPPVRAAAVPAPALGKFWPKYSWNSTGQYRNCECEEVEWEGAYETENACLTAYKSEAGVHGDSCERTYEPIKDEDFAKVKLQKKDAIISEGVKDEGIHPAQSTTCVDLMKFFGGEIDAKDVMVHRGNGQVNNCLFYGLETPLCQPNLGCNALEYEVPCASGFKTTMGVRNEHITRELPKEAKTCYELVEFINNQGGFKTLELKDIQVIQQNKTKATCEQYGGAKPLCDHYCRHLEYELESDTNADSSVVAMGVIVPLFAFLF